MASDLLKIGIYLVFIKIKYLVLA